jgi:hypothetical protein
MHIRYPNAAVDVTPDPPQLPPPPHRRRPVAQVLWASRWLAVQSGRLIGVRIHENAVDVALVARGAEGFRWISAQAALTESQARLWLRTANFRAHRER